MTNWRKVEGRVVRGHGVASMACVDRRFPGGTIALQKPVFRSLGFSLDRYYSGTINLSIAPFLFRVRKARRRFRGVQWTDQAPAEDFSFMDCRVLLKGENPLKGLVYYPHPETKPDHFQAPHILEILTAPIAGLAYGDRLTIELDREQIDLFGTDGVAGYESK